MTPSNPGCAVLSPSTPVTQGVPRGPLDGLSSPSPRRRLRLDRLARQARRRRAARSTSETSRQCISVLTPTTALFAPGSKRRGSARAVCGTAHPGVERHDVDVHAAAADSAPRVVPASERYTARATRWAEPSVSASSCRSLAQVHRAAGSNSPQNQPGKALCARVSV